MTAYMKKERKCKVRLGYRGEIFAAGSLSAAWRLLYLHLLSVALAINGVKFCPAKSMDNTTHASYISHKPTYYWSKWSETTVFYIEQHVQNIYKWNGYIDLPIVVYMYLFVFLSIKVVGHMRLPYKRAVVLLSKPARTIIIGNFCPGPSKLCSDNLGVGCSFFFQHHQSLIELPTQ